MESAFYTVVEGKSVETQALKVQSPENTLTLASFQLFNICTGLLEVPTDILNFLPDTANLKEGFESNMVQAKEYRRDND